VTPLQERLAGTGWLYEPPSRDRWDPDVPPRRWALGLLVPTDLLRWLPRLSTYRVVAR
jgi:hypothetical protein